MLDVRLRRSKRCALGLAILVLPQRLRLRWQPERLVAALAEVEVAEEPVRLDRARPDQFDCSALRIDLSQPGEAAREELHLGPAVADDHDARRFLCKAFAQDELVRVAS